MNALLDTCAVIWLLGEPDRLSARATEAIGDEELGVPVVVLLELAYLQQSGRLPAEDVARMRDKLLSPDSPLVPVHFGLDAARRAADIPRAASADPFDRMVAGTAMAAGLPLITADAKLAKVADLAVIW